MKFLDCIRAFSTAIAIGFLAIAGAATARAGGSPENVLLIIDPLHQDSLYVGNYYKNARNIPDANVLYMDPVSGSFALFADHRLGAVLGTLDTMRFSDHIDFVVVAAPWTFVVYGPPPVADGCSPVTRFSHSGAYSMAYISAEVQGGTLNSQNANRFFTSTNTGRAFDSNIAWSGGAPSTAPSARRYLIGAALGYTGSLGNTPAEIVHMIDRSVAADGTRPAGTFYFEQTDDTLRSPPRHGLFDAVVAAIVAAGGAAEHQMAILPLTRHDCLGIMTGYADPGIDAADITILPGAYCDHLTSWAATFDVAVQEKVSRWIAKGASGSWGAVEEPCNYPGKFPTARMQLYYFQGCSMGEAIFRSIQYTPFQGLIYGDPLTRPFAYLPVVNVPDAPTQPVSGSVTLSPAATTTAPGAAIASLELHVDGIRRLTRNPGQTMPLNTTRLSDGWHDLRVLAFDNTLIKSVGRWTGSVIVNNHGKSAAVQATPATGNAGTPFMFNVSAVGSDVQEIRLVQGSRVLAATTGASAAFTVFGQTLGAGPASVQAEALYPGRVLVRSAPLTLQIAPGGTSPSGQPPIAFNYTKRLLYGKAGSVELPAVFDGDLTTLSFVLMTVPASATISSGQAGPSRLVRPPPAGIVSDSFTYRVDSPAGSSAVATVRLEYGGPCFVADIDEDGGVGLSDLAILLGHFGQTVFPGEDGDLDGTGDVSLNDLALLLASFGSTCP